MVPWFLMLEFHHACCPFMSPPILVLLGRLVPIRACSVGLWLFSADSTLWLYALMRWIVLMVSVVTSMHCMFGLSTMSVLIW